MNKEQLEKEVNYLLNPEATLLYCKTILTEREHNNNAGNSRIIYTLQADIVDDYKNVYSRFNINLSVIKEKADSLKISEAVYNEMYKNILQWAIYGKTCSSAVSLQDAIIVAKAFKYNRESLMQHARKI